MEVSRLGNSVFEAPRENGHSWIVFTYYLETIFQESEWKKRILKEKPKNLHQQMLTEGALVQKEAKWS